MESELRREADLVEEEAAMRIELTESEDVETTWGYMVKEISAHGECLGSKRRRKTWQPAKSPGELATSIDPRISEWGNPIGEILSSWTEYIGAREANLGN